MGSAPVSASDAAGLIISAAVLTTAADANTLTVRRGRRQARARPRTPSAPEARARTVFAEQLEGRAGILDKRRRNREGDGPAKRSPGTWAQRTRSLNARPGRAERGRELAATDHQRSRWAVASERAARPQGSVVPP